ncbi:hypothetical protein TNCV_4807891 [Trichonephila clavipes]|nr:hypothetical protein TNCV_4807891 [Trichonephila clavipes]
MERRTESQQPLITSSREDRHIIRMDLMIRAATSRALSQELGSFARQQVSARTTFLDTENVRLLPWLARSPDLSPIENVWSMVVERLVRHHTPVTTIDDLWHRG